METFGPTTERRNAWPEFDDEPTWANELGGRMEAREEIASRLQSSVGLAPAEADQLVEAYRELEAEMSDLIEYGKVRGWVE